MRKTFRDFLGNVVPNSRPDTGPAWDTTKYYCGDNSEGGATRELTVEFLQARREGVITRQDVLGALEANMKMLELKIQTTEREHKKQNERSGHHLPRLDFSRVWHYPISSSSSESVSCELCR